MSSNQVIALASTLLFLATLLLVYVTLRGIREQLRVQVFQEYTKRYAEIMDVLPFEARRPSGTYDLATVSPTERELALGAMRKYLNLCSEELYLHEKKRIDDTAWVIWRTGIRDTLRLPCFKQAWDVLRGEYDYYPEFCAFLTSLIEENERSLPATTPGSAVNLRPEADA